MIFSRRNKLLAVIGVIVIVLAVFVAVYRGNSNNYYLTTGELISQVKAGSPQRVRVAGDVINTSVKSYDQAAGVLRFSIADDNGKAVVPVIYKGLPPDSFDPDGKVIVEGVLAANGLSADTLLVRCPENYLPEKGVSGLSKLLKVEGLLYK